jgi:hypothetical protein
MVQAVCTSRRTKRDSNTSSGASAKKGQKSYSLERVPTDHWKDDARSHGPEQVTLGSTGISHPTASIELKRIADGDGSDGTDDVRQEYKARTGCREPVGLVD